MTRGKELSVAEKAKIEAFREAGKGYGYIAKKLNRPKDTISAFVRNRMGKIQKKRKGRPRKISKRDERHIARVISNETKYLNDIKVFKRY
jgi:IS30 family transposase